MARQRAKDMDMTQGVIWKQLLLFAFPLMIGNVFQQFYTTVDSIVVGNFVGKEALAAVGSVGPVINSLIGFFMGMATGAGVVISQAYGAKREDKVSRTVHTTLVLTFFFCILFTGAGIAMTPWMLQLMQTPEDVFAQSSEYLKIYFTGITGLMIYNMGAGILRAVGDSKRPLYFLIFSACLNTILDLVFVAGFRMGIAGVAWATVIAQVSSAILVVIVLAKTDGCYRLRISSLHVEVPIVKEIVRIGLPAALQQMITSFSNVFVQSYINGFGSSVMAGWSAYSKIDQFLMLPMQSMSLAATTFTGQNFGAKKMSRIKQGARVALILAEIVTITFMIPLMLFAGPLVSLFNNEKEVLYYGALFLRLLSPFYMFCCINQIYASTLRGLGDTRAPMFIMLGSFVVFRQIYLYTVSHVFGTLLPVAFGYPAGWLMCSFIISIYYHRSWKKHYHAAA